MESVQNEYEKWMGENVTEYKSNYPSLINLGTQIKQDNKNIIAKDDRELIKQNTRDNTPQTVYDLPFDIFSEIGKYLSPVDLSYLRETSKEFKLLVSKMVRYCYWSVENLLKIQKLNGKVYTNYWYLNVHKICGLKRNSDINLIKTPIYIKTGKYYPTNRYNRTLKNIKSGDIPSTVKCLNLSMSRFNYDIEKGYLLKKLEVLIFPNRFNKSLEEVLPFNLKILVLGSNWNCGIRLINGVPVHTNEIEIDQHLFPASLEILVIKSIHFNIDITHILKRLTKLSKLVLGSGYRHKLTHVPNTLKYLEVGKYYTHSLDSIHKNIIVKKNT